MIDPLVGASHSRNDTISQSGSSDVCFQTFKRWNLLEFKQLLKDSISEGESGCLGRHTRLTFTTSHLSNPDHSLSSGHYGAACGTSVLMLYYSVGKSFQVINNRSESLSYVSHAECS